MKIGILGGGIGGLSTAIALKQSGFDVDIYERHSKPTEIGAGIVCWPNASFILDKIGVLNEVSRVSGLVTAMNRFTSNGETIGSVDICQLNKLMNYPSFSILRKDLMSILTRRVKQLGLKIHYRHNVRSLLNKSGKVVVQFDNGILVKPDIVIGADGRMKSIAREYVNLDNSPIYQGFINWVGVFDSDTETFKNICVSDYWGVGERFGIVPISKNKAYWAGASAATKILPVDPTLYKRELESIFSCWPDPINKIINKTPSTDINKIFVHDHDPIDVWHKDNLVLIGDAAHSPLPTSGQGACQALEDAWHLTQCLLGGKSLEESFKKFSCIRKAKTTGITMAGRHLASSIFSQDKQYCQQRDIASKNMDYKKMVEGMAKGWSSGLALDC